jgi:hypothetical protein
MSFPARKIADAHGYLPVNTGSPWRLGVGADSHLHAVTDMGKRLSRPARQRLT